MRRLCPECGEKFNPSVRVCPRDGSPTYLVEEEVSLVGRELDGRYLVGELVGTGGMGAVYRALQHPMEREVALKVLKRELLAQDVAVRRFFREAKSASRLRNPHAIVIHEFGQSDDGVSYIAMELLQGRPLSSLLAAGEPVEPARVVRLADQVLEVLEEAHGQGIVHRDLKPDNLYLLDAPADFVKVLDFGLARPIDADSSLSVAGQTYGTPAYMSPEQGHGRRLDGRTDLYSLGLVMFELLSGHRLHRGDSSLETLIRHFETPTPRLRDHVAAGRVPDALVTAVERLIRPDPDDRPSTAAAARAELAAAIGDLPPLPAAAAGARPAVPVPFHLLDTVPGFAVRPLPPPDRDRLLAALGKALQIEEQGRAFYEDAAARCTSPAAREVFARLRDEEVVHTARFKQVWRQLEGGGGGWETLDDLADGELDSDVGGLFHDLSRTQGDAIRADVTLAEAVETGLAFERRVVDFWEQALLAATDSAERRFALAMVDEERGHVAALSEIRARIARLAAAADG